MSVDLLTPAEVVYPETDGQPMGDNTLQIRWINLLYNGFEALFPNAPDVFVASNLLWYPVEGDPLTVSAPDVMVAFGRPPGDRSSYRQWEEGGVAPQVVWEVLSPSNTVLEMQNKVAYYSRFGVEECYIYDPRRYTLDVWARDQNRLKPVKSLDTYVSRRMGVRFDLSEWEPMRVVRPDGQRFLTYLEVMEKALAGQERAFAERGIAEAERKRADALAARLRALGHDPDALT